MNAPNAAAPNAAAPPLWRPVVAATFAPGLAIGLWDVIEDGSFTGFMLALMFISVVSVFHVLVLGIPYAFWLHRIGRFRAWTMALGGFVAGAVPLGLLARLFDTALFFGAMGTLAALAFYVTSKVLMRGHGPAVATHDRREAPGSEAPPT